MIAPPDGTLMLFERVNGTWEPRGGDVQSVREAGLSALRRWHLSHFMNMGGSVRREHQHPVESCPAKPFADTYRAIMGQP